ncbi:MAG: DUF255 domain-containing protein [Gammaproteobacteria bacterium]|nr:DUF255 domain-containing protein [Gammaproteobacteria bacterium]
MYESIRVKLRLEVSTERLIETGVKEKVEPMKAINTHKNTALSSQCEVFGCALNVLRKIRGVTLGSAVLLCTLLLAGCSKDISSEVEESADPVAVEAESETEGMKFFKGTFEAALVQAEQEQKKVFVDVYTTWCGPCIVMQETVFPQPEVGEYFNARFINFKFDAENEDENGPELAARYDIRVYPTYLILEHDGTEISRANSAMSGPQFVTLVGRMLGEKSGNFDEMQSRFEEGERSSEFVQQFLMDAIVEFSLSDVNRDDMTAMQAYFERAAKFKQIAADYFTTKTYVELVNPIDAHLVLYYKDKTPRGDELVEYVLGNYNDFLAVSSDAAMSQFALSATWYAALDAAQKGDQSYVSYIESLELDPLKHAAEYEQNRDPNSNLVGETLSSRLRLIYLQSIEDWDSIFSYYQSVLEHSDSTPTARSFGGAARNLSRSDNPDHRSASVEYGKRAFELDSRDPMVAADYIGALMASDKTDDAKSVAQSYRSGLTDSAADQDKLEIFDRITGWVLNQPQESDTND